RMREHTKRADAALDPRTTGCTRVRASGTRGARERRPAVSWQTVAGPSHGIRPPPLALERGSAVGVARHDHGLLRGPRALGRMGRAALLGARLGRRPRRPRPDVPLLVPPAPG